MAIDYDIVRYEPAMKKQVVELQRNLWSSDVSLNESYFEWKHERNPYQDKPLVYLAMLDGEAVGMRSFFAVNWESGIPAQRSVCLYADDAVIAPEHRNRGLMQRIMAQAFEDLSESQYEYVFNLSAGPTTMLHSLSMGWRSAGSFKPLQRVPWPTTLRKMAKRLPGTASLVGRFRTLRKPRNPPALLNTRLFQAGDGARISPHITFRHRPLIQAMADLVRRLPYSGRIRHERTEEYLSWRFQNPLSRYGFLFWEGGQLEGYLVLHEHSSDSANSRPPSIVDWEASDSRIRSQLLLAALRVSGRRALSIWSTSVEDDTMKLLDQHRFRDQTGELGWSSQGPALLVRSLRGEHTRENWLLGDRRLTDPNSWDIRQLYSMAG